MKDFTQVLPTRLSLLSVCIVFPLFLNPQSNRNFKCWVLFALLSWSCFTAHRSIWPTTSCRWSLSFAPTAPCRFKENSLFCIFSSYFFSRAWWSGQTWCGTGIDFSAAPFRQAWYFNFFLVFCLFFSSHSFFSSVQCWVSRRCTTGSPPFCIETSNRSTFSSTDSGTSKWPIWGLCKEKFLFFLFF